MEKKEFMSSEETIMQKIVFRDSSCFGAKGKNQNPFHDESLIRIKHATS